MNRQPRSIPLALETSTQTAFFVRRLIPAPIPIADSTSPLLVDSRSDWRCFLACRATVESSPGESASPATQLAAGFVAE